MPRTQGITIQNNFTGGLITESTALNFPPNAATETYNCVFEYTGRVTRRSEVDLEDKYQLNTPVNTTISEAYSEFLWTDVAQSGVFSFLVQQQGSTLHFYNIANNNVASAQKNANTVNLLTYKVADSTLITGNFRCQYAQGNGVLLIVSKAIEPIRITYNQTSDSFSVSQITLQFRDFIGLSDPFTDFVRPAFTTIANMRGDSQGAIHYYNLLNQGWWQGTISGGDLSATSALGQWDADATAGSPAIGTMPSNCDQVSFYRASATDSFDPNRLISYQQGNTLATKGHFILNVGNVDRRKAVEDSGLTLTVSGNAANLIPQGTGSIFGNPTDRASLSTAFDGLFPTISTNSEAVLKEQPATETSVYQVYIGKNYSPGYKIAQAVIYPGYVVGFGVYALSFASAVNTGSKTCNVTCKLYAKNGTAPISGTDGTLLGTATHIPSASSSAVTIVSNDTTTTWDYVWVQLSRTYVYDPAFLARIYEGMVEVEFFESAPFIGTGSFTEPDKTTERPQAVAYFAGRAWYGGIEYNTVGNLVYFSQIIENDDQYGRCYQQNDPTSEVFFNLLPSDGGTLKIPEMAKLVRLYPYQTSLLVLATNGVWLIRGTSGTGFTATDFVVRKLSSNGTTSPQSIVDVDGVPYWCGEQGIYKLSYNPQFDSFSVDNISDETIRSFYLDIPLVNRSEMKGAYDPYNKYVYWIYNLSNVTDPFDHFLVYNSRSKAFFPWSFDSNGPMVKGICYIEDPIGTQEPLLKLTTKLPITDSTSYLTYSGINHADEKYSDWYKWANKVALDPTQVTDYTSYFISGYEIDGQTQKYAQANYVMFFLDQEGDLDTSSAFMQGIYDFTTSGSSGKWSSKQQIYNDGLTSRSLNFRRLKVRGKGRSLQFKVTSESGKPFSIIGWSVWKTINNQD